MVGVALLASIPAIPLAAQSDPIDGRAACRTCGVAFQHLVTVSGLEEIGGITPTRTFAPATDGGFLVGSGMNAGSLVRLNAEGRQVAITGRRGRGPGEFENTWAITRRPGGGFDVLDTRTLRLSLLDENARFLTSVPLPFRVESHAWLGPRLIMVAGVNPTDTRQPLHIVDTAGAHVRSFGGGATADPPDDGSNRRLVRRSSAGDIWASHLGAYVLEQWSAEGVKLREVRREPSWFPPYTVDTDRARPAPLTPAIQDFRVSGDTLWVMIRYPANDWKSHVEEVPPPGAGARPMYAIRNMGMMYNTVFEIIDLSAGRLIHSRRYSPYLIGFLDDSRVFSYTEDEDRVGSLHVWQVSLTRR